MTNIPNHFPVPSEPLRISWTNLLRSEECVRQQKLFSAGYRKPISDRRSFFVGSVTDNAMRKWLELDNPQEHDIVQFGKEMFERLTEEQDGQIKWKGKPLEDQANLYKNVEDALTKLKPWLEENVLPYDYQPEARGTSILKIADWNGVKRDVELFYAVDIAVQLEENKFWLIDLKTTKNNSYVKGKTLAQLTFYAIAWSIKHGVPLEDFKLSFITPIAKDFETPVYPTQDDFSYMLQRIQKFAWINWKEDYAPTKKEPDWECKFRCDVRQSCPLMLTPVSDDGTIDFMAVADARKGL